MLSTLFYSSRNSFHYFVVCSLLLVNITADNLIVDDNFYHLTKTEQEVIVTQLLANSPHKLSHAEPWLNESDTAWNKLDMDLLIAKLDRSTTIIGKNRFKELMKPISSVTELEQRRAVFKKLIRSRDLYASCEKYLVCYGQREALLLSFFDERNSFYEGIKNSEIFIKSFLTNTTPVAGSLVRVDQTVTPIITTLGAIFIPFTFVYSAVQVGITLATGIIESFLSGLYGYGAFMSWKRHAAINTHMHTLHSLMINLASLVKEVEEIGRSMPQECICVHESLQKWHNSLNPTSSDYCADLHALVELLKSNNFTGMPSANLGTSFKETINAYEYVLRVKEQLVPLMCVYGEADAYMAVVRLCKEYRRSNIPLCWTSFVTEKRPFCCLENLYNPLVPWEQAVANSFILGSLGASVAGDMMTAKHMMLTGPHGCGKTTSMKSIAYAYITSQSILLAPATKAVISLLTKIETYLNITDNLAAGMSSFMAEKQYMEALQTTAMGLAADDRCLMVIDEPYAKTLPAVGENRVYNFVNELRSIPQLMILIASHFEKPARLEQESQGQIKNYHPELLEPTTGAFVRTFKILEGVATWWFTDVEKRERFVNWLGELSDNK